MKLRTIGKNGVVLLLLSGCSIGCIAFGKNGAVSPAGTIVKTSVWLVWQAIKEDQRRREEQRNQKAPPAAQTEAKPQRSAPIARTRSPSPSADYTPSSAPETESSLIKIRLSSTIGIAFLVVSYSAALPDQIRGQAHCYLRTYNNEAISNASGN